MRKWIRYIARFVFVLILLGVLFAFAMFQGDFVSWFLFFGFLPIALYLTGLFFYPLAGWHVERKMARQAFQAGGDAEMKLILRRRIPFPLAYLIIEDIFPDSLKKADTGLQKYMNMEHPAGWRVQRKMTKAVFPHFRRVIEIAYTLEHVPRGHHALDKVRVRTGDVFGFLEKEQQYSVPGMFTVMPNVRELRIGKQFSHDTPGTPSPRQFHMQHSNIVTGNREYVPGDKFSAIDWKQTARTNALMTKEFEQEKNTETLIVLDSCSAGENNALAFEAAVEMTVSLLEMMRRQGTQAGLLTIGRENSYYPQADHAKEARLINRHLTALEQGGTHPFAAQLKEAVMRLANGPVLAIITNQLDEAAGETLRLLKLRGSRLVVFFIKPGNLITGQDEQLMYTLRQGGIDVSVLTEEQLAKNPIEVNM
jgi:uncharacterized protein (DUF58 family)